MVQSSEISMTCRGGGSLVNKPPIFSSDSKFVYVIWKNSILCYNAANGERVQEYIGLEDEIVSMYIHPINASIITACSTSGHIMTWNVRTAIDISNVTVQEKDCTVRSFHILRPKKLRSADDPSFNALVSFTERNISTVHFATFNTKNRRLKPIDLKLPKPTFRIALGGANADNEYFGVVLDNKLRYVQLDKTNKRGKYTIGNGRTFTCIACHPEHACIATGDSSGRILIWHQFGQQTPTQAVFHWHTLPVNTVIFSHSGSHFYSGADECVVVKWTLDNPSQKQFAVRLPAPIKYLAVSPENVNIAVSLDNNGVQIYNSGLNLVSLIQHLVWGIPFAAGMHVDPRTKSLVLNGYIGYVQFYSPIKRNLLYNLDIVGQNKITSERNCKIKNTDVTKIAMNANGLWLGTVEEQNNFETSPEIRLKFWQFDTTKQTFALNTSVELPHEISVRAIQFQPNCTLDTVRCVTIGADCKFKVWNLVETDSIHKTGKVWECSCVGFYRDLPTNAISFSIDGSLLGVAFDDILTTWTVEPCELKCSLIHPNIRCPLKQIHFGAGNQCHLVVAISEKRITVWNLLTLTVVWTVPIQISVFCVDPSSTYMAAFTTDSQLFVFCPSSPTPVYHHKKLYNSSGTIVLAAVFVPRLSKYNTSLDWQKRSKLYFVDTNQELYSLDDEKENDYEDKIAEVAFSATSNTVTPFSTLLAKTKSNYVSQSTPVEHLDIGISSDLSLKQFLDWPVHTMAPMRILCGTILESIVLGKNNKCAYNKEDGHTEKSRDSDSSSSTDAESEDESAIVDAHKRKVDKQTVDHKPKTFTNKEDLSKIMDEQFTWALQLVTEP